MRRFLSMAMMCAVSVFGLARGASAQPATEHLTVDGQRVLQVKAEIAASPDAVWRIWTTPEGFKSVFGATLTIELRPGGPFEIEWDPSAPPGQRGSEGCKVLTIDPQHVLSFEWNAPPKFDEVRNGRKHWVTVTLEPKGPGTVLTLRSTGFGDTEQWNAVYDYFTGAWPFVVGAIQKHFAKDSEASAGETRDAWVYLIVDLCRPDLIETMTEQEKVALGQHFEYLKKLTHEGQVVVAGPCTDMKGPGIVVFHAKDESTARGIMEGDPAVKAGIFKAELHPMRLALLRERDRTDQ